VVASSVAAMGLAALFEVRGIARATTSRRGAFGFNAFLQIVLALALVGAGNYFAFQHFERFDLTQERIFTLSEEVRDQLAKLPGETDIIIVQQYVSFGQKAENKQDKYDFAAQRKIVEKVKDLADQFGELGPRFHVHLLDTQDEHYADKFDKLKK